MADTIPDAGASDSDEANGSNASQVLALGADFRFMRCISFGPGADADESSESQVLASGPTLDSLASFDAFAAVDAGAPEGAWGGTWI